MANKRFPRTGDTVLVDHNEFKKFKGRKLKVIHGPLIVNRKIVVQVKGIRGYVPVKYLQIVRDDKV